MAPVVTDDMILVNAYSTLLELPKPEFAHVLHNRRDLSDPELLPHLDGFCGCVMARGEAGMSPNKYHVILHLQRVQHHASLSVASLLRCLRCTRGRASPMRFCSSPMAMCSTRTAWCWCMRPTAASRRARANRIPSRRSRAKPVPTAN
ncbi:hypothetical protein LP419_10305 [Massilia sp. H-1]|nr:hypothetical protein LP419_10305 [Massilia sp. H-1]